MKTNCPGTPHRGHVNTETPCLLDTLTDEWKEEHQGGLIIQCQKPTCPDYGDPDFGGATCPEDHARPR